jgi:hypothetical protein
MATLQVQPKPTPEERADRTLDVEVDEALSVLAATIEEWTAPRQSWEFTLHEGHDFGRANNVEGRLLFVGAGHTCSVVFRLDQLDRADDVGGELVLVLEENDGIAKLVRAQEHGLDLELHHILTFT